MAPWPFFDMDKIYKWGFRFLVGYVLVDIYFYLMNYDCMNTCI